MKADILNGKLCVTPSNSTESYALDMWCDSNFINRPDMERMEPGHFPASCFVFCFAASEKES